MEDFKRITIAVDEKLIDAQGSGLIGGVNGGEERRQRISDSPLATGDSINRSELNK